ncbi:phosphotransferase family protein [Saccharopolyspora rhizosphaerae]|uniref:phosphotransferase family protein n=1 Tax=Saccharopolyspora rhizosphaerae TaxID=2492662 RepID=UPI0026D6390A|nr:aminoglycoside phosphotransferase family protein [Saccharopolyspora rhizosphaerae]
MVAWLAEQGQPVIPPSPLVPREPVQRDGFSMTFWQFTEIVETTEPDYVRNAGLVADLHQALRAYPGELPFLSAAEPQMVTGALADLAARPDLLDPADLARAQQEWEVLKPLVRDRTAFEAEYPVELQPVHGDAPPFNIVPTPDGELYADFELVSLGPVEWDLAAFGSECEAAYDRRAQELGLRALDEQVLRFVNAVGNLRSVACLSLVPQLPMLADALRPAIEQWRLQPFAGG